MSKYSGSITIVDYSGESVFERELTSDEIIETLLERRLDPPTEPHEVAIVPTKRHYKKRGRSAGNTDWGIAPKAGRFTTKECS